MPPKAGHFARFAEAGVAYIEAVAPQTTERPDTQSNSAAVNPRRVYARIAWRLIPYIFVLYILAYLDRVNVGFAALEMKRDLGLSNTVYGTGAGIFFLGQGLFDLPSNLLFNRFGPRKWITRIMLSWGLVATAMMFVKGPWSFYILRFLLGVTEAGFFPGMILYLTRWFPSRERAGAVAKFMTATSLAGVIGAPLSGALLKLEGHSGLHGWQWLFLVEGVPTFLMGISVYFYLHDCPDDAPWLSPAEKHWLDNELAQDRKSAGADERHSLKDAFRTPTVWILALIFLLGQIGVYTVNLWMPLILNTFLRGGAAGSALSADAASRIAHYSIYPYIAAAIFTVIVGWSSDRTGERRGHIAACMLLAAGGFAWAAYAHSLSTALVAFTLAAIGCWSIMGPFWALPTRLLSGQAAAGGVAVITMLGSIGGFLGPWLTGWLRDATHGFAGGLLALAGVSTLAALLCFTLPRSNAGRSQGAEPAVA